MRNFFGDVVVYKGNSLEAKILKIFTGEFTHSALRINEDYAESLDWFGHLEHNLKKPKKHYLEYVILRHKEMTPEIQRNLERFRNSQTFESYDLKLLFKLAKRKLQGYIPNKLNFSNYGKTNCSSELAEVFDVFDLKINRDIHYSQIEPHHFVDSRYFDVVGDWKR